MSNSVKKMALAGAARGRSLTRVLVAGLALSAISGCGGGGGGGGSSGGDTGGGAPAPPIAIPVNSSGVAVSLKPGVQPLPATVSVTPISDTAVEINPPQSGMGVGTVFTANDRAYVVTSVSSSAAVQTVGVRPATLDEAIHSLEIDGDLDVRSIDFSRALVQAEGRSQALATARSAPHAWSGNCSGGSDVAKNTFDVSCDLGYKTEDKRLGVGGQLALKNVDVSKIRYSSLANASDISASISANVSGRVELGFYPQLDRTDQAWSGTPVLARLEIPIPGTFGFGSLRIPISLEYRALVPPLNGGVTFAAKIVDGQASDVDIGPFFSAFEFKPQSPAIEAALDGYARLVVGAEIAASTQPVLGVNVLPDPKSDLASIGAYFKVGPSMKMAWKWREADLLNCVQLEASTDWFFTFSANTRLNALFDSSGIAFTQKLKGQNFAKEDWGNCIDRIAFEPSSTQYSTGRPLSVAALLKAYKVGGEAVSLPEGIAYSVSPPSGVTIDQVAGVITPDTTSNLTVTAETATGLRSNNLSAVLQFPPGFYLIRTTGYVCEQTHAAPWAVGDVNSSICNMTMNMRENDAYMLAFREGAGSSDAVRLETSFNGYYCRSGQSGPPLAAGQTSFSASFRTWPATVPASATDFQVVTFTFDRASPTATSGTFRAPLTYSAYDDSNPFERVFGVFPGAIVGTWTMTPVNTFPKCIRDPIVFSDGSTDVLNGCHSVAGTRCDFRSITEVGRPSDWPDLQ